jgi:hypothetical protein
MSQNEKSAVEESKRRRSPVAPMLPIDEAIEKAGQIYAKDKRAFTDFKTLVGHLGYKVERKGGRSGRVVSTLKQYGLLDERAGQYRISETAWKILEMPEDSAERAQLIKESALNPSIARKILRLYNGELPSDATLRSHLLFKEGFNADSATDLIRVLRRTIELVNPQPEDYNTGEESEGAELPFTGGTPAMQQAMPPASKQQGQGIVAPPQPPPVEQTVPPVGATGEKVLVFNISRNSEARVFFNGPVTQEAITKLSALLELSKDTFPTKEELERPQPRSATWRNKDHDQPVKVTGDLGEKDGKRFYAIEGSGSGIPEDELEFEDEGAA